MISYTDKQYLEDLIDARTLKDYDKYKMAIESEIERLEKMLEEEVEHGEIQRKGMQD